VSYSRHQTVTTAAPDDDRADFGRKRHIKRNPPDIICTTATDTESIAIHNPSPPVETACAPA
jgi:hypothetical protein